MSFSGSYRNTDFNDSSPNKSESSSNNLVLLQAPTATLMGVGGVTVHVSDLRQSFCGPTIPTWTKLSEFWSPPTPSTPMSFPGIAPALADGPLVLNPLELLALCSSLKFDLKIPEFLSLSQAKKENM